MKPAMTRPSRRTRTPNTTLAGGDQRDAAPEIPRTADEAVVRRLRAASGPLRHESSPNSWQWPRLLIRVLAPALAQPRRPRLTKAAKARSVNAEIFCRDLRQLRE